MASTTADPAKEQEPADADDESVFTDSEEEEGELQLGRRDVASDDEGDAEEGEIRGAQAAASAGAHHISGFPDRAPDDTNDASCTEHCGGHIPPFL